MIGRTYGLLEFYTINVLFATNDWINCCNRGPRPWENSKEIQKDQRK